MLCMYGMASEKLYRNTLNFKVFGQEIMPFIKNMYMYEQ